MRVRRAAVTAAALFLAGCPSSPTSSAPATPPSSSSATPDGLPAAESAAESAASAVATTEPSPEAEPAEYADCTLERSAIRGRIATDAPAVARVIASAYDPKARQFREEVLLRDGVTLRYSMGGCHHYGYGFTWVDVPAGRASDMRAYAQLAKKRLEEAPLRAKEETLSRALDAATREAPKPVGSEPPSWSLPCGDATCELSVTRTGDTLTVSASYDFPM